MKKSSWSLSFPVTYAVYKYIEAMFHLTFEALLRIDLLNEQFHMKLA